MDGIKQDKKFSKIIKSKINRIGRGKNPSEAVIEKLFDSSDLIEAIHKKIKGRKLLQEARKQFVINSITSMEVLLKDCFIDLLEFDKLADKFPEYCDKNFSLEDFDYFEDKDILNSEVISSYYNFQNLYEINKAFSKALDVNFFDELKDHKFWYDKKIKKGFLKLGDFYTKLDKLINLRHDFVHDINFDFKIYKREIDQISHFCMTFMLILEDYISDKIDSLKKKYPKN